MWKQEAYYQTFFFCSCRKARVGTDKRIGDFSFFCSLQKARIRRCRGYQLFYPSGPQCVIVALLKCVSERGRGRERVTREEEISKRKVLAQLGEIEKEASKPPREAFVVSAPWRSSWQFHHLPFASRHLVSKPSSLFHCKRHLWAPRNNCSVFVLLFAKQASEAKSPLEVVLYRSCSSQE